MFSFFRRAHAAMLVLVAILAVGCGNSHSTFLTRDSGGGDVSGGNSTLIITQTLLSRAIPVEVTEQRFTGRDAAQVIVFGPRTEPKAARYEFTVPASMKSLTLEYLVNGQVVGIASIAVALLPGGTLVIDDPDFQNLDDPGPGPIATLRGITVTPSNPTVPIGRTQILTAIGTFSDGSTEDLTSAVTWSSNLPARVSVSNSSGSKGVATAASAGSPATLTATLGAISGSTQVSVTTATLVSIAITPLTPVAPRGTAVDFKATGLLSDGGSLDLTSTVSWGSSSSTVATISNSGLNKGQATAVAAGKTTITASDAASGLSDEQTLVVVDASLLSIAVTPASPTVTLGRSQQMVAMGSYTGGLTAEVTSLVTWSSSAPLIASISNTAGSRGLVTPQADGTTQVTASLGTVTSGPVTVRVLPRQSSLVSAVDGTSDPGTPGNDFLGISNQGARLISADGNRVVFTSYAYNLTSNSANSTTSQIFLRDVAARTTTLISVTASDEPGDGNSLYAAISADGQKVAFTSHAPDLVADDTNSVSDLFLSDLANGTLTRVREGGGFDGIEVFAMSADATKFAYIDSDENDVYFYDSVTPVLKVVSANLYGNATGDSGNAISMSDDGRKVAFVYYGDASVLVSGAVDTNNDGDVFLRDTVDDNTILISSKDAAGMEAGDALSTSPSLSANGQVVAFVSYATDFTTSPTSNNSHVYVRGTSGTPELVSQSSGSQIGNNASDFPSVSEDGRFVTFRSDADNLDAGDTNNQSDIFVRDRATGQTRRISLDSNGGQAFNSHSTYPYISANGRFVAYQTRAFNLIGIQTDFDQIVRSLNPLAP